MNDIINISPQDVEILEQRYNVTLPVVFDTDRIQMDMLKIRDRGMLSKYVFGLKRRFTLNQEIKLIEKYADYFRAAKPLVEAVQNVQNTVAQHQVELSRLGSEVQRYRAIGQEHKARAIEAVVRQARALAEIEKISNPTPRSEPLSRIEKRVQRVLTQKGDAQRARLRVIQNANLTPEQQQQLFEAIDMAEFEEVNHEDI